MPRLVPPGVRVLSRVDTSDPEACWLYDGTPSQRYPQVWNRDTRRNIPAHVSVYLWAVGPVPEGGHVHHRCEQTHCVNPAHLIALTAADHNALHHTQTHCVHGHEFTPENTIHGKRQRSCRICQAEARRRYRQSRRHPCADCGTEVSIRAKRCNPCHAKWLGLGTRYRSGQPKAVSQP